MQLGGHSAVHGKDSSYGEREDLDRCNFRGVFGFARAADRRQRYRPA
jgi:hypothetical protein